MPGDQSLLFREAGVLLGNAGLSFGDAGLSFGDAGLSFGNAGLSFGNAGLSFGDAGLSFGNAGLSFGNAGLSFGEVRITGIAPTRVPSPKHAVSRIPMANERGASGLMVAIVHSATPPVKIRLCTSAIIKSCTR